MSDAVDAKPPAPRIEITGKLERVKAFFGQHSHRPFIASRIEAKRPPAPEKETTDFERYIQTGLEAIKQGNYEAAFSIFSQPEAAQKVGLEYDENGASLAITGPLRDLNDAQAIIHDIANNSWFDPPTEHKSGKIRIAHIEIAPPEMSEGQKSVVLAPEMRELIFHNVALLNAEEWIHALRFKQGIDIHSDSIEKASDLDEAQVALYMLQHGVPLTERFLTQYGRRGQLRAMGYQV